VSVDSLSRASDTALARRAGMGDAEAFTEVFHRHFAPTFRYAVRMLDGDDDLAQDAVQGAWVKIWQRLPDFRGDSRLQTWLFTVVARQVLDTRRRRRPLVVDPALLEPIASTSGDPVALAVDRELWETLAVALSELPWRQRATWILRELDGQSYDEIAQILGTTPTVVRGQLHRARKALAIRMEEWR